MIDARFTIAESYLRMIPSVDVHTHDGMYVRLAAHYGVPFGRIMGLSGLPAATAIAYLEAGGA